MTADEEFEPLWKGARVEAELNVSPSTRRRLTASGKLPSVRLSNKTVRYRPREVRELIARSETAPTRRYKTVQA